MSNYDGGRIVVKTRGLGFCGFLALIFITCKLCKIITWSWLWVLSPLWIPFALVILSVIIVFIYALGKDN